MQLYALEDALSVFSMIGVEKTKKIPKCFNQGVQQLIGREGLIFKFCYCPSCTVSIVLSFHKHKSLPLGQRLCFVREKIILFLCLFRLTMVLLFFNEQIQLCTTKLNRRWGALLKHFKAKQKRRLK